MVHEKLKVKKLVVDTEKSANRIDEAIERCDAFKFSYLLGDTDEARGATTCERCPCPAISFS